MSEESFEAKRQRYEDFVLRSQRTLIALIESNAHLLHPATVAHAEWLKARTRAK